MRLISSVEASLVAMLFLVIALQVIPTRISPQSIVFGQDVSHSLEQSSQPAKDNDPLATRQYGKSSDLLELAPKDCSQEASLRSIEGVTASSIEFFNNSGQTVQVYWINYSGQRVFYQTLFSGSSYVQPTYLTQPWLVTDTNLHCLGIYLPIASAARATISAPVKLENKMTTKSVGSGCDTPTPNTTFLTTDSRVLVWFSVSSATTGSIARVEWFGPTGSLYTSSSWSPLTGPGGWCFSSQISIANSQAASLLGTWIVKVYYDDRLFFSLPFTMTPVTVTAKLTSNVFTRSIDGTCTSPTPLNAFLTTDDKVWIWFNIDNGKVGDTARIDWYSPNGSLYTTQRWGPITWTGGGCFWNSLSIANAPLANLPGNWSVKVYFNDNLFFISTFTIVVPTFAGAVVIDGTDSNDHGSVVNGANQKGWLYMQRVLESLARQVPLNAHRVVVDIGTIDGTQARNAINSAFTLSSLPGMGWQLIHVDGVTNINSWLTNLSIANTGILCIPTYNTTGGDLTSDKMSVINARAANIARFFTGNGNPAQGGALFAMAESNTSTLLGSWQWLQALFPGIVVADFGTDGVHTQTDIALTLDGASILTGLTNAQLVGANPWHNAFTFTRDRLKVLGVAPDDSGALNQVILGGTAGDIIVSQCNLSSSAVVPASITTGSSATFSAIYTLSGCTGVPIFEWDFGDGSAHSSQPQITHVYATTKVYNWKLTVTLPGVSSSVQTGTITVNQNCTAATISKQPDSLIILSGRTATLSVVASGTAPITYQWYEGLPSDTTKPINGAVFSNLVTPILTSSTSYWVRVRNGCALSTDSNSAKVTIAGPGNLTIEIVDPNCDFSQRCNSAYLKDVTNIGTFIDPDRERLATANVYRSEVATDGVTLLLLRVRSQNSVKFSISGSPARGELLTVEGVTKGGEVTVAPSLTKLGNIVFAVYRAPIDYNASQVVINAVSSSGSGSVPLKFRRPPIVLVHGVWSDGTAWMELANRLREQGFDVCNECLPDYGSIQPAGSFDPNAADSNDQVVIGTLHRATLLALSSLREKQVAVTQVDVIGHSMGGLVARARAKSSFPVKYFRTNNYNQGYFHKLITVGTPHRGSPLADFLIEHKCDILTMGFNDTIEHKFENGIYKTFHKPLGPAIYGFQTSSDAIKNIGSTNIPSHAIVGIAPDTSDTEDNLNLIFKNSGSNSNHDSNRGTTIDGLLSGNGNHDTLVTVESQRGGLLGVATTEKPWGIVHANVEKWQSDTSETGSADVWTRVAELLKTSTQSASFGNFTALNPVGKPRQPYTCPTQSFAITEEAFTSTAITMLTPTPGTIIRAGDTVQVNFRVTGGNKVDGALFTVDGQPRRVDGVGLFSFSYPTSTNRAGRVEISASTFGSSPENYFASTFIIIAPSSAVSSITAMPTNLLLEYSGEKFQFKVAGRLVDGTQIDLTSSTAGTSYSIQSGTNKVITISPEGIIEARGNGQDVILVTNSNKTTMMNVYVSGDGFIPNLYVTSVSSASYSGGAITSESIIAAFGASLATTTLSASSVPLPTSLAGTSIIVRDSTGTERLAPLFFVSPGQVNYLMPSGTALGPATVTVTHGSSSPALGSILIDAVAPGLYGANANGQGVAAAIALRVKADGSQSVEPVAQFDATQNKYVTRPLDLGPNTDQVFLVLFGTGIRFNGGLSGITSTLGSVSSQVLFAGPQGSLLGLDQVNIAIPRNLIGRGEVDIVLTVDGKPSNIVRVSIK